MLQVASFAPAAASPVPHRWVLAPEQLRSRAERLVSLSTTTCTAAKLTACAPYASEPTSCCATCLDADGVLRMDESISVIPDSAFMKCPNLTAALLPAVEEVGRYTFSDCDHLSWVAMPNALAIGDSAFYGSSALHSLFMPVVQTTGESAFEGTECGTTGADCSITPSASPATTSSSGAAPVDCTACIQGFIEAGGCNAMLSDTNPEAFIPSGCDACGESDAVGQQVEQICSALIRHGETLANGTNGTVPMLGGNWTGEFGSPTVMQCDSSGACASSCCTCDGPEVADCLTCPDGAPPVDDDGDGAGVCIPAVVSPAPSAGGLSDQESTSSHTTGSTGGSVGEGPPDCVATCEDPPENCTQFLSMTTPPGCASACAQETLLPYMAELPDAPCTSWEAAYDTYINGRNATVSIGTTSSSGATVTPVSDGTVSSGATVTPVSDGTRSAASEGQASGAAAAITQGWSNPPDCSTCAVQFGRAGGCSAWEQGGEVAPLVPAGCSHCEQVAYVYCFNVSTVLSCEQCVQTLDQAGGCTQWTSTGIFPNASFPSGCGHCGNEAYRYCFNATSGSVPADSVAPSYRMLHFGQRQLSGN